MASIFTFPDKNFDKNLLVRRFLFKWKKNALFKNLIVDYKNVDNLK